MSGTDSLRALQEIFPSVEPSTLQKTLQSCDFNVETAVEITLRAKKPSRVRYNVPLLNPYL